MTNKPGFYVATVRGAAGARGVLHSNGCFSTPDRVEGFRLHPFGHYTDLRPLWAADPESDDYRALAEAYMSVEGDVYEGMRAAIRALASPSLSLVEPNGLGAVVDCKYIGHMVRGVDGLWRGGFDGDDVIEWSPVAVIGIRSHGVGCTCGGPDCPGGAS